LEQQVQNIDEAEMKAGFRPYLPSSSILTTSPRITVTGAISMEQTIHVGELAAALQKAEANDVQVPAEWEGVQLRYEIGPTLTADYSNDVQIVQARPTKLVIPSNFALAQFAEAAFRSVGASSWKARVMAQKFAAHPAWLLDIPSGTAVSVQELEIHGRSALLIQHLNGNGALKRATVFYTTGDQMFSVSSGNVQLSTRIAENLP
jgi:hypothetical protein